MLRQINYSPAKPKGLHTGREHDGAGHGGKGKVRAPQRSPEITPPGPCPRYFAYKFFGPGPITGAIPSGESGINDNFEVGSVLVIKHMGVYGTRLRLCLQGPEEGDAQGRQGEGRAGDGDPWLGAWTWGAGCRGRGGAEG